MEGDDRRALARRALDGLLPPEVLLEGPKPVFNSLLAGALAGPDHGLLRSLLGDPHPELAARVRRSAVAELVSTTRSAAPPLSSALDLAAGDARALARAPGQR